MALFANRLFLHSPSRCPGVAELLPCPQPPPAGTTASRVSRNRALRDAGYRMGPSAPCVPSQWDLLVCRDRGSWRPWRCVWAWGESPWMHPLPQVAAPMPHAGACSQERVYWGLWSWQGQQEHSSCSPCSPSPHIHLWDRQAHPLQGTDGTCNYFFLFCYCLRESDKIF